MILLWALYVYTTNQPLDAGGAKTPRKQKNPLSWGVFTSYSLKSGLHFAGIMKSIGITTNPPVGHPQMVVSEDSGSPIQKKWRVRKVFR